MGREIRRVPEGWDHPRYTNENAPTGLLARVGQHMPLHDEPFAEAMREWVDEWEAWERGERPSYCTGESRNIDFWEWGGGPPDPAYHRPNWDDGDVTHFQYYETVTEGTPLSPPMPSLESLADWLVGNRDFCGEGPMTREQADAFVGSGWAPSGVMQGGVYMTGIEFLAHQAEGR